MSNFKFSGVDTVELAKKYGTPLYLLSQDIILNRIGQIKRDFLDSYENTRAAYASKALLNKEMARLIKSEGLGMDVVSAGEIYLAASVDFPMEDLIFHGNNKSRDELEMALDYGVGRIVVDSQAELELLGEISKSRDSQVDILLRVSPGVESKTHSYIQTAQEDSKFGLPLKRKVVDKFFKSLASYPQIKYRGLHFHIGSQLEDSSSHLEAVDIIFALMDYLKSSYALDSLELNTGGGYGVGYADSKSHDLKHFIDPIMARINENSQKRQMERPKIIIEPGRWIVAEAGMTIYRVGVIKEIPGIRTYLSVDGGMTDNIRPSLYGASYDGLILNKFKEEARSLVRVSGKCCESGDILIKEIYLANPQEGDYLGIMATGAYNHSMASNYNKLTRPAMVMIGQEKDWLIVKRESYEDLIRNDI